MNSSCSNHRGIIFLILILLINVCFTIKANGLNKNKKALLKSKSLMLQRSSTCNKDKNELFISIDNVMAVLNSLLDFRSASRSLDKISLDAAKLFGLCMYNFNFNLTDNCKVFISSYLEELSFLLFSIRLKNIEYSNIFYNSTIIKASMINSECVFSFN